MPSSSSIGSAVFMTWRAWAFPIRCLRAERVNRIGFTPHYARHNSPGARHTRPNPLTVVTQAIRGLAEGGPVAVPLVQGLAWSAGILAVFGWLAVRTYRRAV